MENPKSKIEMLDIPTAAKRLGVSGERVRQMIAAGRLPGATKQGQTWRIPTAANARLASVKSPEQLSAELDTSTIAPDKLKRALWKRGLIEQCRTECTAFVHQGGHWSVALAAFAKRSDIPVRTIQRWIQRFKDKGLAGLVDSRGSGGDFGPVISPAAWNEFQSMYLDPREPSVKACWQNLDFLNRQKNLGWTIPSLRTMQQYVDNHIPKPVLVFCRKGKAAYEASCAPYIETDMDTIEPGAVWIGDHHPCDCWVRYRNNWIRPWITCWEDMRSRAIVGWCITASPNSTTILRAFKNGCEQFGPPAAVKVDNGKDYDSQMFTGVTKIQRITKQVQLDETLVIGLYALMNISVSFALPYHPQSKAVEPWFGTFEKQFGKTMLTYCGKDTSRRPEELFDYLKTEKAVEEAMELDEFAEAVGQYLEIYNNTAHAGRGMDSQSPMQVLNQRAGRRVMADGVMDLLLRTWTGELLVGKNGVTVKGLAYGKYDAALLMHQGRKVRCSYNPDDLTTVNVHDARSYQLVAVAEQNTLIGYGAAAQEEDLREAQRQRNRAAKLVKQYKPAARVANMNLTDLTLAAMKERTQPAAQPQTPAIRPVATVLDGQVALHRQLVTQKKVRRAAGAESLTHTVELTLNPLSSYKKDPEPTLTLGLPKRKTTDDVTLTLFRDG